MVDGRSLDPGDDERPTIAPADCHKPLQNEMCRLEAPLILRLIAMSRHCASHIAYTAQTTAGLRSRPLLPTALPDRRLITTSAFCTSAGETNALPRPSRPPSRSQRAQPSRQTPAGPRSNRSSPFAVSELRAERWQSQPVNVPTRLPWSPVRRLVIDIPEK